MATGAKTEFMLKNLGILLNIMNFENTLSYDRGQKRKGYNSFYQFFPLICGTE